METERTRPQPNGSVTRSSVDRPSIARGASISTDSRDGVASLARRVLHEAAGGGLKLPAMTLRFWDGSALSSDQGPVVLVRDPAAIVHVLRAPGQLGLARAWVDGSLDVDDDLEAVLQLRDSFSGVHCRSPTACGLPSLPFGWPVAECSDPRRFRRSKRDSAADESPLPATALPCGTTTTSRITSTASCSARPWSTHARTSPAQMTRSKRRRSASST